MEGLCAEKGSILYRTNRSKAFCGHSKAPTNQPCQAACEGKQDREVEPERESRKDWHHPRSNVPVVHERRGEPHPHDLDARNPVRRRYWQAKRQERTDHGESANRQGFRKRTLLPHSRKRNQQDRRHRKDDRSLPQQNVFLNLYLALRCGCLQYPTLFTCGGRRSQDEVVSPFLAIYKGMPLVGLPPGRKEQYERQ